MIESRTTPTPVVLEYMDSMIGMFRAGGFSADLTHHVMHAMGSRILGFTQELFDDSQGADPEEQAAMLREMAGRYPLRHRDGHGCGSRRQLGRGSGVR